jgi:hypothetical protein
MMERYLISVILIALLAAGCAHQAQRVNPRYYDGPTDPMVRVVNDINANNEKIPTFLASHDFEATIVDEKGKERFVNGSGRVTYRQPYDLLLRGNKELVGTIFEVGSNSETFWLTAMPVDEPSQMWWGHYANLGKPCVQQIPIRPDLIVEVLGVSRIDTDFTRPPAPTMRFNNDQDAYMFVWNVQSRGPDRWIAQKEVWYDRQSKRPMLVVLFDHDGRIILRAYLSKHLPVRVEGLPEEQWPVMATEYSLFFPENKTKLSFSLKDVVLERKGIPNDGSFTFPDDPGVAQVNQIDADCTD